MDCPAPSKLALILQPLLQSPGVEGDRADVMANHTYVGPVNEVIIDPVDPPFKPDPPRLILSLLL